MQAPLSKIRYWLARVNIALERQAARAKFGTSDIREWLASKYEYKDMENDGFYVLGDENYDSDDTANFFDMYPDEIKSSDTWDLMKCACSSIFLNERHCPENCTCLNDRFNSGSDLFTKLNTFTTQPSHSI